MGVSSLAVMGASAAQAAPTTAGTASAASPWGKPIEVPGLGALKTGQSAFITSISCVSAGNCAAAGSDLGGRDGSHSFIANEHNGAWGKAFLVRPKRLRGQ